LKIELGAQHDFAWLLEKCMIIQACIQIEEFLEVASSLEISLKDDGTYWGLT
jgi:hypothetical protein